MILIWRSDPPRKPAVSSSGKQQFSAAAELCRSVAPLPEPGLEPEGKAVPIVHHQLVLAPLLARHPRLRLRSCRRPFHTAPACGRYSLPHAVLERLLAALTPARNRESALVLAVFLARYWTSPARLGQVFQIDRRALVGHHDLPLTEARIRGAIAALEEVGYLARIVPEPGRRYQRTPEGLHRQPLAFRFGGEFASLFEAANKRPRRSPQKPQDGRRPLPASPLSAMPPRHSWSPPEQRTTSPKKTSQNPTFVDLGEIRERHSRTSSALRDSCQDSGLEAALKRLAEAMGARLGGAAW